MICGGIDLGGTKIEARLFSGPDARPIAHRRVPTPRGAFDDMIAALSGLVRWLEAEAGRGDLPVAVAAPGAIDPVTGQCHAANIPAAGQSIAAALEERIGRAIPVINDAMAFACSEAQGGAGERAATVMGLILGTGLGGGFAIGGALAPRAAGLSVEIGHVGVPARALARHGLPAWPCGCGKTGCFEGYVSGTGLANIAEHLTGARIEAHALDRLPPERLAQLLDTWADLAGECLYTIQLMLDPACIVLGGGLSKLPGVTERLRAALATRRLGTTRLPPLHLARHGDTSGARGAALLARAATVHGPC